MPLYEYRCRGCSEKWEKLWRNFSPPESIQCSQCSSEDTFRIVSRVAFKRDIVSELDSLDPKYDKMVDNAANNTRSADPYKYISKSIPLSASDTD